jgi:hypothetical protein
MTIKVGEGEIYYISFAASQCTGHFVQKWETGTNGFKANEKIIKWKRMEGRREHWLGNLSK